MLEPASIIGLISGAIGLAQRIHSFTSMVRGAPDEAKEFSTEIAVTQNALGLLRTHLQKHGASGDSFDKTSVLFCAVDGCKEQLQRIENKVSGLVPRSQSQSLQSMVNRLKWPFEKDDIMNMMQALRGYVQIFHFAVNLDGMNAIQASQTSAVTEIRRRLDTLTINSQQSEVIMTGLVATKEAIAQLQKSVTNDFQRVHELIDQSELDPKLRKLIDSLQSLPFQEKHRDLQMRRQSGLGRWFLEMPKFKEWREGTMDDNILWCHGSPGVGKTYLASLIIDHLYNCRDQHNNRVLYFYFDYRLQSQQTAFDILVTLLQQLLSTYLTIPATATDLYNRVECKKGLPEWKELIAIFKNVCESDGDVFLVFDALDECDEHKHRDHILNLVENLFRSKIRILVTSRPYPWDIKETFVEYPQITIEASDSDIREFLIDKIQTNRKASRRIIDKELQEKIVQSISAKSHGMFLLPALQITGILGQTTKRQILGYLEKLPSGLNKNLDMTMDRIRCQDVEDEDQPKANLALMALMCLSVARQPLSINALRHAIATVPGQLTLDDLIDPATLVESCIGLVTIDIETKVVRFVHFAVGQYLEARRPTLFPFAEAELTARCLAYLTLDQWKQGELKEIFAKSPFADYATTCWSTHVAACYGDSTKVKSLVAEFLRQPMTLTCWIQKFSFQILKADHSQLSPRAGATTLHVAATLGLDDIAQEILSRTDQDPNDADSIGRTALIFASINGHIKILDDLLSHPRIVVNSTLGRVYNALVFAIIHRHADCARALISAGINVNIYRPLLRCADQPALHSSSELSRELCSIAKMLLKRPDLDVNAVGTHGGQAWYLFTICGDVEALELILNRPDLSPSMKTPTGRNALDLLTQTLLGNAYRTETALHKIVLLLARLDRDSRFEFGDFEVLRCFWAIFYFAFSECEPYRLRDSIRYYMIHAIYIEEPVESPFRSRLKQLLESSGFSLFIKDSQERTFLHYLASSETEFFRGDIEEDIVEPDRSTFVKFLLQRGLDVNARDASGRTPLHYAAVGELEYIAEILLDAGAGCSVADAYGNHPLHLALQSEYLSAVPLLLRQYPSVSQTKAILLSVPLLAASSLRFHKAINDAFHTPLQMAVLVENLKAAEALIDHGANLNTVTEMGSALNLAIMNKKTEMARMLIVRGADLSLLDCYGKSTWDWIAGDAALVDELGLTLDNYTPTQPQVSRRKLIDSLTFRIREMLTMDWSGRLDESFRLGQQLLYLNDEDAASIAFENLISVLSKNLLIFTRKGCMHTNIPYYVCKRCPWAAMCSSCMSDKQASPGSTYYIEGGAPWRCDHELFRFPSRHWDTLPKGIVNVQGQSFNEWLEVTWKRYMELNSLN